MNTPEAPDFASVDFLQSHVHSILEFYQGRVVDSSGGYYQTFRDDGAVYDAPLRHLVSSTRFVWNYAMAARIYDSAEYRATALHGLQFLQARHRQSAGHYAWELYDGEVRDGRAMTYGHAFVMLAASAALQAGIDEAKPVIEYIWQFLEEYFWQPEFNAYADERDATLSTLDSYRGQNANMHTCEALLAAYQATSNVNYLDRAYQLAHRFTVELVDEEHGLIWEHYDSGWHRDMHYNIDKPDDLFKPWGFQPGHQVEWCKLLLQLRSLREEPWMLTRAAELYAGAMSHGWDNEFGGLVYGFAPDTSFCDANKYFWVQAEAFAAAWRLYRCTGEDKYLRDYNRIWQWSWNHLIDHHHGAWFRIRTRQGGVIDDLKSPPGKTDYHTMGACWDVLSQHPDHAS